MQALQTSAASAFRCRRKTVSYWRVSKLSYVGRINTHWNACNASVALMGLQRVRKYSAEFSRMHLTSAFHAPGIWDGRAVIASSLPSVFRYDLALFHPRPDLNGDRGMMPCHIYSQILGASRHNPVSSVDISPQNCETCSMPCVGHLCEVRPETMQSYRPRVFPMRAKPIF